MKELLDRLIPLNLQQFAEGDGAGASDPAGAASGTDGAGGEGGSDGAGENNGSPAGQEDLKAQLEQMKADMARQKAALDAATSEAAKYKKELRTKQTQEEIDAANKEEADKKAAERLAELEKLVARANNTKTVMGKLGVDEDTAGKIAESMSGCENPENALLLIKKAWDSKEKALRLEFGKVPEPGAGGSSKEDAEEKAAIETAKRLGKERAEASAAVEKGLAGYLR